MKKFDSINVIPFIDIMLVLLAIVLTTATFVTNGQLDIDLPAAGSDSVSTTRQRIEIAIDRDEQFFLDGEPIILRSLTARLEAVAPETRIALVIDESVEFHLFVAVIDILKAQSLENISIVTREVR